MRAPLLVTVTVTVLGLGLGHARADAGVPELAACAQDVGPGAAAPVDLAQLPAEKATGAGVRARFALIDAAARRAEEAAIAAWAPAWAPDVHVDATGMATSIAFALPGTRTPASALRDVLAFVRAHACLFGVADPSAITAHVYIDRFLFIDHAPRTIGAIEVGVTAAHGATTVTFTGHLWPIADSDVAAAPGHVLARYLGRAITQDWEDLSPDTFGNHRTLHVHASERDFTYEGGRALLCRKGVLDVHAAAYVELHGKPEPGNGPSARLAELPTVVSLDDGQPFGAAWIMPRRIAPDDNWAGADRMNDAGAACLGIPPP